jgi:hypothetical protein
MPEDQVTIDPEFRPPAPAEGQSRRLRVAGVVGVVMAAFAFGWFLRSPAPSEPQPDEGYASATTTTTEGDAQAGAASTTTRPPTTTTTSEPPEAIELEVPLSGAIPGFTDVITMEQWSEAGVDVIRWRSSQSAPETVAGFGHDDGSWFAGLDTSGTWYALQNQDGVLSVHQLAGVDASLAWFPDLQAVGVRVSQMAWHDTKPGQLAWLACSRTPGGPGTLFRLDVADDMAEPVALRLVDKACSENSGVWLQQWGDWGFVLGESEGAQHETVLLAADGGEVIRLGDDFTDTWLVAGYPDGTIWTGDTFGLHPSSFVLSPDGQSRLPVPGLEGDEWLDDAIWSPDGTLLALSLRTSANVNDEPVIRIVNVPTATTVAEMAEPAREIGLGAWSTDSRFLLYDRWLCPDGCVYFEPEERELAFYDTLTDTTTMIRLPTDGGWGGIRLADPDAPAELVAHYPLDADAADVSGYENEGRSVLAPTPTSDRFGTPDAAYSFDGEKDRILVDMRSQLATETVSIAAWVKMHDAAGVRPIGEWWNVVSYGGRGHVLAIQGEGAVLGGLQGTAADCEFMGSATVLDGDWHHVAMTRDANWTIRVYLDGAVQPVTPHTLARAEADATTDATCAAGPAFGESVSIGGDPGHREYFDGSIDDVRIYSGVLTNDEIAMLATDTP